MKIIDPVSIWQNGQTSEATILNAYAVNVTLNTSATFYYALLSDSQTQLAQGNLTMDGAAYQAWNNDLVAWEWIANQLNLTIIGEYVPPVTEIVSEEAPVIEEIISEEVPVAVVDEIPTII